MKKTHFYLIPNKYKFTNNKHLIDIFTALAHLIINLPHAATMERYAFGIFCVVKKKECSGVSIMHFQMLK